MKKCKHKNIANKFIFSDKYGEPIKVEYTYCQSCGEIFKGGVSFIPKPTLKPRQKRKITYKKKEKVSTPIKPESEILQEPKIVEAKITAKSDSTVTISPPEKKKAPKLVVKQDKPVVNTQPPRTESKIRKNTRKPTAPDVPEGATIADILKAKYGIKSETKSQESVKVEQQPRKYKEIDDPYQDSDDGEDIDIFVK